MRFWKGLSIKGKIRLSDLMVVSSLLIIFSLWPPSVGRFAVNEQGLAPHLPPRGGGDDLNWLEVLSLQSLALQSRAALVVSAPGGRVIAAKQPHRQLPIASLTKLITVKLVRLNGLDLQRDLMVTPLAINNHTASYVDDNGAVSRLGLTQAESFSVSDLLKATLVASANDAALTLTKAVTADNDMFQLTVQSRLAELGLVDTKVFEPTGLNPANISTVIELARLAQWVWDDEILLNFSSLPEVTIKSTQGKIYTLSHTNELVKLADKTKILASKTGYLDEAGYNLVQLVSLQAGNKYLIILLGAPSREARSRDAKLLANWLYLSQ